MKLYTILIRKCCSCKYVKSFDISEICVGSFAGTTYLESNLTHLSVPRTIINSSCSFTFIKYTESVEDGSSLDSYTDYLNPVQRDVQPSMALDWRIGAMNCREARHLANFVCRNNSDCVDFNATLGGYLCNCSKGYTGNPYLNPGCLGW